MPTLKRFLFVGIIICIVGTVKAQQLNTDSLWQVAETTKDDRLKFDILVQINDYYQSSSVDTNFYYAKSILDFAEKTKNKKFIAYATLTIGYPFIRIGDFKNAQECITSASKIIDEYPDDEIQARINNYQHLAEQNPNKKIAWLRKAILSNTRRPTDNRITFILYRNLANVFYSIQKPDSALVYVQKANEFTFEQNDFTTTILLQTTFANVYTGLKQYDLAYVYCRKALLTASESNQIGMYLRAYQGIVDYFDATGQNDSALYYQKKIFSLNDRDTYIAKIATARWLYNYYQEKGDIDSTNLYMNYYIVGNDSLNNTTKITEVQKAKFEEELRQHNTETAKAAERANRNNNIQLIITAIVILSAIILFLLLSRSIFVTHKMVEFLSIIILLVVFEFINLLIHPFLEKVTHHSPVLMLLGLVMIAALIVPFHHRLEKWATKKLVEKNKATRLAQAKKTIEELEYS
jgi:tetratricopeptide (TPR) repeat protein